MNKKLFRLLMLGLCFSNISIAEAREAPAVDSRTDSERIWEKDQDPWVRDKNPWDKRDAHGNYIYDDGDKDERQKLPKRQKVKPQEEGTSEATNHSSTSWSAPSKAEGIRGSYTNDNFFGVTCETSTCRNHIEDLEAIRMKNDKYLNCRLNNVCD